MDKIDYKTEGNILYPDKSMLTWGPFYYHSEDKAKEKMEEVLKDIVNWCNLKDPSLNITPKDVKRPRSGIHITFEIQAWRDEHHLEDCNGIITVEPIFFED